MKLRFWKMSGAGNDFVLLAGLPRRYSGSRLARRLCPRREGIGADGLISLSRRDAGLRIDYWNADGSSAFCGNACRCAALWARSQGWTASRDLTLITAHGPLKARIIDKTTAEVAMPEPKDLRLGLSLKALGKTWTVHGVDVGVPHAVVFAPRIGTIDVMALGRRLRSHRAFGSPGANVDFVEIGTRGLQMRTYERGVEGETGSCGTGAVAAAFVARALGRAGSSVRVQVRDGSTLDVLLTNGTRLAGPGQTTFTGEVEP